MKPEFEKPTQKEIEALYLTRPIINLKTADGADLFVDLFLEKFEDRYTNEELDLGLQDEHIREAWYWYEQNVFNRSSMPVQEQQTQDHLSHVRELKAKRKKY